MSRPDNITVVQVRAHRWSPKFRLLGLSVFKLTDIPKMWIFLIVVTKIIARKSVATI